MGIGNISSSGLKNDFSLPKEVNVASRLYFLDLKKEQIYNRMKLALEMSERSSINCVRFENDLNEYNLGIVTSGVSYSYTIEALEFLKLSCPILKIGFINPLPEQKLVEFFFHKFLTSNMHVRH